MHHSPKKRTTLCTGREKVIKRDYPADESVQKATDEVDDMDPRKARQKIKIKIKKNREE